MTLLGTMPGDADGSELCGPDHRVEYGAGDGDPALLAWQPGHAELRADQLFVSTAGCLRNVHTRRCGATFRVAVYSCLSSH